MGPDRHLVPPVRLKFHHQHVITSNGISWYVCSPLSGALLNFLTAIADRKKEVVMVRLVTRGCFTHAYAKGLVGAPEDREPAVRKLVEGGRRQALELLLHDRRHRLHADLRG